MAPRTRRISSASTAAGCKVGTATGASVAGNASCSHPCVVRRQFAANSPPDDGLSAGSSLANQIKAHQQQQKPADQTHIKLLERREMREPHTRRICNRRADRRTHGHLGSQHPFSHHVMASDAQRGRCSHVVFPQRDRRCSRCVSATQGTGVRDQGPGDSSNYGHTSLAGEASQWSWSCRPRDVPHSKEPKPPVAVLRITLGQCLP